MAVLMAGGEKPFWSGSLFCRKELQWGETHPPGPGGWSPLSSPTWCHQLQSTSRPPESEGRRGEASDARAQRSGGARTERSEAGRYDRERSTDRATAASRGEVRAPAAPGGTRPGPPRALIDPQQEEHEGTPDIHAAAFRVGHGWPTNSGAMDGGLRYSGLRSTT